MNSVVHASLESINLILLKLTRWVLKAIGSLEWYLGIADLIGMYTRQGIATAIGEYSRLAHSQASRQC